MGNILFVIGIGLVLGHQKTLSFFARKEKFKGTACFLLGVGLILARYPLIGFVIELYGIMSLFGDFFGVIVGFVGAVPVVSLFMFSCPAEIRSVDGRIGWAVFGAAVKKDYGCDTAAASVGEFWNGCATYM